MLPWQSPGPAPFFPVPVSQRHMLRREAAALGNWCDRAGASTPDVTVLVPGSPGTEASCLLSSYVGHQEARRVQPPRDIRLEATG